MTAASAVVLDENGLVENVIVVDVDADRKTTFEIPDKTIIVLEDGSQVTFGWTLVDDVWTEPVPVELPDLLPEL